MKKIAINVNYGGFCLTDAVKEKFFLLKEKRIAADDIERDDPVLIQIIESVGVENAGKKGISKLRIVEIPDDADDDWEIEENEGYERVVQKHREWRDSPTAETPKKVVINCKFGGFSLSEEVKKRYIDATKNWDGSFYNIERDDPVLIQIIESVGVERAGGGSGAKLKIVGIPADIPRDRWEIEEYDGAEWVSEAYEVYFPPTACCSSP